MDTGLGTQVLHITEAVLENHMPTKLYFSGENNWLTPTGELHDRQRDRQPSAALRKGNDEIQARITALHPKSERNV